MKNLGPADRVNFFTSRTPDAFAMRIRIRRIGFIHRVVEEPSGNHHALVKYLLVERSRGRKMVKSPSARSYFDDNVLTFVIRLRL
jgi:hypothetical protein